jgi:undecaprenyl phosphate-alpha-L-ara4FN deformylase
MNRIIGLQVHVDTFSGMKYGVPRLLDLFGKHTIKASFFVPMGKDHTGWTIKRVFTRKGFIKKAGRTDVLKTYGVKTLMYGLLLPGPRIAEGNRSLFEKMERDGHEIGIHGLDHVYWHDHIKHLDKETTDNILAQAVDIFAECTGTQPRSFAAPGWMINSHALSFFERKGFLYSSDTRGYGPFWPRMDGAVYRVLQIPSTMPTLDEMVGLEGTEPLALARYFTGCLTPNLNVISVHAELEGKHWIPFLASFIEESLKEGYTFQRLADIAKTIVASDKIPTHDLVYGSIRGRAGEVTLEGNTPS